MKSKNEKKLRKSLEADMPEINQVAVMATFISIKLKGVFMSSRLFFAIVIMFVSCSPKSGEKAVDVSKENSHIKFQANFESGTFQVNPYPLKITLDNKWTWLKGKNSEKPQFYFLDQENSHVMFHLKFINQNENDFAKNLVKLQDTYQHLMPKWNFIEENIDRIAGKKTYYMKFGFYNEVLKEKMICHVYNIQVDKKHLATLTFKIPKETHKEYESKVESVISSVLIDKNI
jgi:hypothetical protein